MGTVFMIDWTYVPAAGYTEMLHDCGYNIISMALEDYAVPVTDPALKNAKKKAVIFGSEGDGLKEETLKKSDHVAVIPMLNGVDSLNVAASSAVTFWELFARNGVKILSVE